MLLLTEGTKELPKEMTMEEIIYAHRDNPEVCSHLIQRFADVTAAYYLSKEDTEGYLKFIEKFASCQVEDYRQNLQDKIFHKMTFPRPTLRVNNYLDMFFCNRFKSETQMSNYLDMVWDIYASIGTIIDYYPQYKTTFGRCDYFIKCKESFLLELKIYNISVKDIYQCLEYHYATDGKYPVAILGSGISSRALEVAKHHNISVYKYSLPSLAPTLMRMEYISGNKIDLLQKFDGIYQYINGRDPLVRDWGWPLSVHS